MKEIIIYLVFFACIKPCNGQVLKFTKELTGDSSVQIKESANRSLQGRMGPLVHAKEEFHIPLIVNGFVITDHQTIRLFRELYLKESNVRSVQFYNSQKTLEKFDSTYEDGVLLIKMKKNVLIKMEALIRE